MNIIKSAETKLSDSCAVENYDGILKYMCSDIKRSITLTSYQGDKLKELFGKHSCNFKGEFLYKIWIVEFEDEIFELFSNKTKGLCIAIRAKYEDKKAKVIKKFLIELENALKN